MQSKYTQEVVGDYIRLASKKKFYPMNPRAEDITVEDIAHALSNLCRFTGHTPRFYSVAEHSIQCAKVAKMMGLPPIIQFYALWHDVSEVIVNDLNRPTKQYLKKYKDIEDRIMVEMWKVAGLPSPTKEDYNLIKIIDNTLLINELIQLMEVESDELPVVEHRKMFVDLSHGYGAGESKIDFLTMYTTLMEEILKEESMEVELDVE